MTIRPEDNDRGFIHADSAQEQVAYMLSRFGDPAAWSVISQQIAQAPDGRDVEHVQVGLATGDQVNISFVTRDDDDPFDLEEKQDTTGFLDAIMRTATAFSEANPPHHPGTLARFPVPSGRFTYAVALPMPVLAVSNGVRGLFAPPRFVAIDFRTLDAIGVGEFPGFEPEEWPPMRLGDWPPRDLVIRDQLQLQGTIQRFSACWHRVLTSWFNRSGEVPADLGSDIAESLSYRTMLDPPEFLPYYDRLNPTFADWVGNMASPAE